MKMQPDECFGPGASVLCTHPPRDVLKKHPAASGRGRAKGRSLGALGAPTLLEKPVHRAHWVESYKCYIECCARSTGDSYGRTTDACEQRFNSENLTATLEVG